MSSLPRSRDPTASAQPLTGSGRYPIVNRLAAPVLLVVVTPLLAMYGTSWWSFLGGPAVATALHVLQIRTDEAVPDAIHEHEVAAGSATGPELRDVQAA